MKAIEAKITLILVLVFFSSFAFAGTSKISTEDFNSMIVENMKMEKELQKEVQQKVGVEKMSTEMQPHLKITPADRDTTVEHVASKTASQIFSARKTNNKEKSRLDRDTLERVSEEINGETP